MNVELRIERLVLTGVPLPPGGRAALAGAFGRELTRLIQDGGLAPALLGGDRHAAADRHARPVGRGPGRRGPAAGPGLGRELARSVYSCLGGS